MKNLKFNREVIVEIFKLWNDNFAKEPDDFETRPDASGEDSADYFIKLFNEIKAK